MKRKIAKIIVQIARLEGTVSVEWLKDNGFSLDGLYASIASRIYGHKLTSEIVDEIDAFIEKELQHD